MALKRTQISGLIGMVGGGVLLVWQFRDFGGQLEPMHWVIPAIIIGLGVLYFLIGDHINGKKKPDKPKSSE